MSTDADDNFHLQRETQRRTNAGDRALMATAQAFLEQSIRARYSYDFDWLSRPIIQYPQDMIAMQELIWRIRPDLIIETGIAHGGSLIFSASMLALIEYCDAAAGGTSITPARPRRRVVGIDIDIRPHNRAALAAHPLAHAIDLIEGSSVEPDIVARVRDIARDYRRILVCLDSNHTHDHVLRELRAYAPLVSKGSYCVVFDTIVERLPAPADRPWSPGNSPMTAVEAYLSELDEGPVQAADGERLRLAIDAAIDQRLLVSVAPRGYLRRESAADVGTSP